MFFGLPDPGMALFLAETPTCKDESPLVQDYAILAAAIPLAILVLFAAA